MNIGLKGLPLGEWRDLTDEEMDVIYGLLEGSSNEDVSKTQKKPTQTKAKTPSLPSNARTSKSTSTRSPARGTAHRNTDKKIVSRKTKPRK
jgi:23S rRNA pseudouridine2604 synthase